MAEVTSYLQFNQNDIDLSVLYSQLSDLVFSDNQNTSYHGVIYEDVVEVYYSSFNNLAVFGGVDFSFSSSGSILGGTVTGVGEAILLNGTYTAVYVLEGISLSAIAIDAAIGTVSTQDDLQLISTALSGADIFNLSGFNDLAKGLGGNDTLNGKLGNDTLYGGAGKDRLNGDAGNDFLYGEAGKDRISGGSGTDRLLGGSGNDLILGKSGNDVLEGGRDNDTLNGGSGADDFVFANKFGNDVITDFNAQNGNEDIDLSAVTAIKNFKDLKQNHMQESGDDVVISVGKNTITLENVDISDLGKNDFIF